MFENFGTAIVQAIGFFGVFGFFVYRLLSEKSTSNSLKVKTKSQSSRAVDKVNLEKKGLFGRKKKVEQNIEVKNKESKRSWFNR